MITMLLFSHKVLFTGYRAAVLQDENLLEMDGGDGCTTI